MPVLFIQLKERSLNPIKRSSVLFRFAFRSKARGKHRGAASISPHIHTHTHTHTHTGHTHTHTHTLHTHAQNSTGEGAAITDLSNFYSISFFFYSADRIPRKPTQPVYINTRADKEAITTFQSSPLTGTAVQSITARPNTPNAPR